MKTAQTYALALLLFPISVAADQKPFTLEGALRLFRTHGFDLIIADAAIVIAQGDVAIAEAIANPSLSFTRGSTFHYNSSLCEGCSSTSVSGGITDQAALSDNLSGKRRL